MAAAIGGDGASMQPFESGPLFIIAHSGKFNAKRREPIHLSSETTLSQT
jgi:hypothetical protein